MRKVWAALRRATHNVRVSHRRVYAVMRATGLCLARMGEREEVPCLDPVATTSPKCRWATDLTTAWTKEDGLVAAVHFVDCPAARCLSPKRRRPRRKVGAVQERSGVVLLSHTVSRAVPSALASLTSEFGMGSGVTSPL